MAVAARLEEEDLMLGLLCLHPVFFAEHFWKDELSEPMSAPQRMMFADTSQRQISCTARKVFKTGKLESRFIQKAITNHDFVQREGLFTTPGDAHMQPVLERIIRRVNSELFFNMLLEGINRQTGIVKFKTGWVWHCRIDGTSQTGRNMIGLRAAAVLADEQAYGNDGAHMERIQSALPRATWDYNGVPNGVRSTPFYRLDQTTEGQGWSHHHLESFDNPIYQPREEWYPILAEQYGGENNPDFIRQALGLWGDEASGAFSREHMTFQERLPYQVSEFTQRQIEDHLGSLSAILKIPRPVGAQRWLLAADIGIIADPTVIKMAYERDGTWYDACRITLRRIGQPLYVSHVIAELIKLANAPVVKVCVDIANYGKAVFDFYIGPAAQAQFAGVANWERILLSADSGGQTEIEDPTDPEKRLHVTNKHYYTMLLKGYMARGEYVFPGHKLANDLLDGVDNVQLTELLTTVEEKTANGRVVYKPAKRGDEHITDGLRYMAHAIDAATGAEELDMTLDEIGWSGGGTWDEEGSWQNPWLGSVGAIED